MKNVERNKSNFITNENHGRSGDNELEIGDFPTNINCLSRSTSKFGSEGKLSKLIRLYGLTDFLLLTPENPNAVASETHVKLLMSSFCISAFNTRWFVRY